MQRFLCSCRVQPSLQARAGLAYLSYRNGVSIIPAVGLFVILSGLGFWYLCRTIRRPPRRSRKAGSGTVEPPAPYQLAVTRPKYCCGPRLEGIGTSLGVLRERGVVELRQVTRAGCVTLCMASLPDTWPSLATTGGGDAIIIGSRTERRC